MKTVCRASIVGIVAAALALPILGAADDAKKETATNPETLAETLITQCARVKDGDIVQISGGERDIELLYNLTVAAAKRGADTLLTLSPNDRTTRRLFTDVPAKFDTRTSPLGLKLAETVTVTIGVDSSESEAVLADIPAERRDARAKAAVVVADTLLKRNVRTVYLGNGLYPTETRAKEYGLAKADLAKLFYAGLSVDYDRMRAAGEAARAVLAGGKTVHITSPQGTDLTVEIASRPAYVSDGVLSDDKLKRGGPACQAWLPAGEVYLTSVPGTAEGKVVVERMLWDGKEVRGLSLTFAKGKLTAMTATAGLAGLQALYDAAGPGKDEFSWLDIGINPAVRLPRNSPVGLIQETGMITIGTGNNTWAGGDNKASFGITGFLRGGTLQVDGKDLVRNGSVMTPR